MDWNNYIYLHLFFSTQQRLLSGATWRTPWPLVASSWTALRLAKRAGRRSSTSRADQVGEAGCGSRRYVDGQAYRNIPWHCVLHSFSLKSYTLLKVSTYPGKNMSAGELTETFLATVFCISSILSPIICWKSQQNLAINRFILLNALLQSYLNPLSLLIMI